MPTQVYAKNGPSHRMTVTDEDGIRVLWFDDTAQSSMSLEDPFETSIEYPAYFHIALALTPRIGRVLVIGLGGGTVVKRLWHDYPEMSLDVVELDPDVVDIAHRFFALPQDERIHVIVDDGRRFLEGSEESWDLVIVDAFEGQRVPGALTDGAFIRIARDRLRPDGVLAFNVIARVEGEGARPLEDLCRAAEGVFRNTWVFKVLPADPLLFSEDLNFVVLLTDNDVPVDELLARIEGRVGGRVTVPGFHTFALDVYRTPE